LSAPLQVAYTFDGAYELLAGVSLTSLLHHNPGSSTHVRCFVHQVSDADRTRLAATAERYGAHLDIIDFDDPRVAGLPLIDHLVSPMIYARLLLPQLLPDQSRLLYLDADTLVLGSLRALAEVDFQGAPIAAVPDVAHEPLGKRFGLPPHAYFNAGVQLMNFDAWRRDAIGERCLASLAEPEAALRFGTADQDALNALLKGNYRRLPDAYNHGVYHRNEQVVLGVSFPVRPVAEDTRILQFLGRVKPHMAFYLGEGGDVFERYRAVSEWRDVPLMGPVQVSDLMDMADKLCQDRRPEQAVDILKQGLMSLADRLAQEQKS
jgi:lipopolysaccharide biosynthesis glycosyltransferase